MLAPFGGCSYRHGTSPPCTQYLVLVCLNLNLSLTTAKNNRETHSHLRRIGFYSAFAYPRIALVYPLKSSTPAMSTPEESPAQRAARLRRERREAKIKEGGSARLDKITSLSGRTPQSGKI